MFKNSAKYCQKKKSFEKVPERHQVFLKKKVKTKAATWMRTILKSSRG